MKHFSLRVTALSPLAIRSDHAQGGVKGTGYIPGTTLLGSLAASHRMLHPEPEREEEFASFFLNEQVCFPHLYPAQFRKINARGPNFADSFHISNHPVMSLPKTARTCKRFPGFLPVPDEKNEDERHGVRDSLLDWALFSLLERQGAAIPTLLPLIEDHATCNYKKGKYSDKECRQAMDAIHGYYRRGVKNPKQRMKAKVETRLQTRTGINRQWGIVEESILYNREVFEEGMTFWGEIILPDEPDNLAADFEKFVKDAKFVEDAKEQDAIRIGTGRTRGLGRVSIDILPASSSNEERFKKKLNDFDTAMRKQAQDAKVREIAPFYFAITLQSPVILCDRFLRYQKTLATPLLPEVLGLSASAYTFECVYQAASTQRITGWNELWGTPRPNDYAIEAGSTFLFGCRPQPGNDLDDLIDALRTKEETGIGRRRSEGFGRISISDPFHLEREQA